LRRIGLVRLPLKARGRGSFSSLPLLHKPPSLQTINGLGTSGEQSDRVRCTGTKRKILTAQRGKLYYQQLIWPAPLETQTTPPLVLDMRLARYAHVTGMTELPATQGIIFKMGGADLRVDLD
jgi:hypothetical protein